MKIAIIARPRTRSIAITKSLAHWYNLEYLGESYFRVHDHILRYYSIRKNYDTKLAIEKFTKQISDYTSEIFQYQNFIVKIFPNVLHFPPSNMIEKDTFDFVKSQFIFDMNHLNIKGYNKIYFLDRPFYDSVLSWAYCHHTRYFHKKKQETKKYTKIEINERDLSAVKFYIIEYFLHQKIKNYLDVKNISYTYVNETNYDLYIDNEYLNIEKTNINYKDYIINLDKLIDFVEKWYPICEVQTQDWNFY